MNKLSNLIESLNINHKELANLLKLSKEESKQIKTWIEDDKKIPHHVLEKIKTLPLKHPLNLKEKKSLSLLTYLQALAEFV